jgi:hypothetical protein
MNKQRAKRIGKYAIYIVLIYLVVVTAIAFIRPLI